MPHVGDEKEDQPPVAKCPPGSLPRSSTAEDLARHVLHAYNMVGKKGKPQGKEWTVLAGIVATRSNAGGSRPPEMEVVAVATGNRCVGRKHMSRKGDVINDSHAEILACRCLRSILFDDVERFYGIRSGGASGMRLLARSSGRGADGDSGREFLCLRPGTSLHLVITETPCGDASIYATPEGHHPERHTGAKPSGGTVNCPGEGSGKEPHHQWHQQQGVLRTKSCRSDTLPENVTCSMSCSDKIALWGLVGVQGSLLSCFVERVRIDSVVLVVGDLGERSAEEIRKAGIRALRERFDKVRQLPKFRAGRLSLDLGPDVLTSSCTFERSRSSCERRARLSAASGGKTESDPADPPPAKKRRKRRKKLVASCGFALISPWPSSRGGVRGSAGEVLISARGIPQGLTKSAAAARTKVSSFSKSAFLGRFVAVAKKIGLRLPSTCTYRDAKNLAIGYRKTKEEILQGPLFQHWRRSDHALEQFTAAGRRTGESSAGNSSACQDAR